MMYYLVKSEGMPPVEEESETVMGKVESLFLAKFHLFRKLGDDTRARKYLHFYNHVVELRNRTEFGL
jgi:hypothetical protein